MDSINLWDRSSSYKGKRYPSYSLATNYTDDRGKKQKHEIKKLGKLTDNEANIWRLKLKIINSPANELSLVDFNRIKYKESKKFLDVALISHVYDSLGLNEVYDIPTNADIGTKEVAKILILSRYLDPLANYKTVDWFNDSYLPNIMNINPQKYNKDKIHRELSNIFKQRKYLQKKLNKIAKSYSKDDIEVYFFDGTTSFFEGTCCELAEATKDKTHGYQDKVILILLVTDKQGYPIYWDVFNGRASEKVEIKKVIKDLCNNLNISEVTFCFDRGFRTESNLDFIEDSLYLSSKYISGLDKNQIDCVFDVDKFTRNSREKLITALKTAQEKKRKENKEKKNSNKQQREAKKILPINGFNNLGKDRFYQDLGIINSKRHIISFNMNIYEKEGKTRLNLIERTKKDIKDIEEKLLSAKGDRDHEALKKKIDNMLQKRKLTKIFDYTIIPKSIKIKNNYIQTYKITYKILKEEIKEASKYDGILVYITNHTEKINEKFVVAASTIVNYYKSKQVIENAFRYIKAIADLRPFYVYLPEHVNAHVDICFCSYFINTYINDKLIQVGISLSQFHNIIKSHSRVCKLDNGMGQTKSLLKTLSNEAKEIINLLDASTILSKKNLDKLSIQLSQGS